MPDMVIGMHFEVDFFKKTSFLNVSAPDLKNCQISPPNSKNFSRTVHLKKRCFFFGTMRFLPTNFADGHLISGHTTYHILRIFTSMKINFDFGAQSKPWPCHGPIIKCYCLGTPGCGTETSDQWYFARSPLALPPLFCSIMTKILGFSRFPPCFAPSDNKGGAREIPLMLI